MVDIPSGIGTTAVYTIGAARLDQLESTGDSDWFRVTLVAGTAYAFAVTGARVGAFAALGDSTLTIYNASGSQVAFNDDGSTGLNSFLSFTATYSGTYFLAVGGYNNAYSGGYELLGTAVTGPTGGDDLPGGITTTRQLSVGQPVNARIETAFDEDAVFIDLSAGTVYRFEVRGAGAGLGFTLPDPYLVIANSSGTILADNDDISATNLEARLDFTAPTTGRYYIGAFDITGGTGTYQFAASIVAPAAPGPGNDSVTGTGNNDSIWGLGGDDTLTGLAGNDTLDGGAGQDRLFGGSGDDLYLVDSQGDLTFESAGGGTDTVVATTGVYLWAEIEAGSLASSAGAAFLVGNGLANALAGNDFDNLLLGGAGNDSVRGMGGNDILYGEGGVDSLQGGDGIDYLIGGAGNDSLFGDSGADALYGEDGDDWLVGGASFETDILIGGAGNDTLAGNTLLGDYDLLDGGAGNDIYFVDTYADVVYETADGGNDSVFANIADGGYYLYAGVENLYLSGTTKFGVGNELANLISGSNSTNWLLGGSGDDTINGGGGNDVLFGEGGADLFQFDIGTGGDAIGDFTPGTDRIDVRQFGFASFAAVLANMVEVGGTAALNLGNGDFVVFNGVAKSAFSATDFVI